MKELVGRLQFVDLGSGGVELITDDGQRYQLVGDVDATMVEQRVRVVGTEIESFGFMMTGNPSIRISTMQRVD